MQHPVALTAKGNQVPFGVIAQVASGSDVVHFQPHHRATGLAPPMVPLEYGLTERAVGFRI
jgi:hypothetical protein